MVSTGASGSSGQVRLRRGKQFLQDDKEGDTTTTPRTQDGKNARRTTTPRTQDEAVTVTARMKMDPRLRSGSKPFAPIVEGPYIVPVPKPTASPSPVIRRTEYIAPDTDTVGLDFVANITELQSNAQHSNTFAVGLVTTLCFMCIVCLSLCSIVTCVRACRKYALKTPVAREDLESALPNYTLVSGLPTYDEALDQLQRRRELRRSSSAQRAIEMAVAAARAAGNLMAVKKLQATQAIRQLSVGDLIRYNFRSNSFDKS